MNMDTDKLYKNEEWLRKKYWDEGLSLYKIGNICKADHRKIWHWMKELNIPRRSPIPNNTGYKNKEWLYNKYINEKLSLREIGKLCKVDFTGISRWIKRHDIKSRSKLEGCCLVYKNHCNLSQEAIEWISGELLGDGHLHSWSSRSAVFTYGSKYLEYIKYVKNILKLFGVEGTKIYKRYNDKFDCYSYHYQTRRYPEFLPIRKKWYPEGKKVVPRDIKLTSLTIRQWMIGDGSLGKTKKGTPYITLATCGFFIKDVEFLVKKLKELGFKATRQSAANIIRISTQSTKDFLDYIGKCPVNCYQYKFNY